MDLVEELRKLKAMHESGVISDDEFALAKSRFLRPAGAPRATEVEFDEANEPGPSDAKREEDREPGREREVRQWALLIHLSQFAGYAIPLGGLVLPILLWQWKKHESPEIDAHGKVVANWIVSELIYGTCCLFLFFFLIGIPLMLGLLLLGVIFPLIGAVKANDGVVWRYPLSLQIFT
jgi:uncharacterized Tic20 family protein